MTESAATGIPTFLLSLIIMGFLFSPAPSLAAAMRKLSLRVLPARGQEFVQLAGATIRNVSQGVIGIALLQAVLSGLAFVVAGVPGSGLLALAALVFGILQFPSIVMLPVTIWSWTAMPPAAALASPGLGEALLKGRNAEPPPLTAGHGSLNHLSKMLAQDAI